MVIKMTMKNFALKHWRCWRLWGWWGWWGCVRKGQKLIIRWWYPVVLKADLYILHATLFQNWMIFCVCILWRETCCSWCRGRRWARRRGGWWCPLSSPTMQVTRQILWPDIHCNQTYIATRHILRPDIHIYRGAKIYFHDHDFSQSTKHRSVRMCGREQRGFKPARGFTHRLLWVDIIFLKGHSDVSWHHHHMMLCCW